MSDTYMTFDGRTFTYSFWPLLIVTLGDVALYSNPNIWLKYIFAIGIYGWVLYKIFNNIHSGILYLLSFNLVTLNIANFWDQSKSNIVSYWGIRVGDVSLNIVFTILLTFYYILSNRGVLVRLIHFKEAYTRFIILFFFWSLLVGLINVFFNINYLDNFKLDLLMFSPLLCYIILLRNFTIDSLKRLICNTIGVSLPACLLAYIIGSYTIYGTEEFIITSTIVCLTPLTGFCMYRLYPTYITISIILITVLLLATSSLLLAGKMLISFILLLLWYIYSDRYKRLAYIILLILLLPILLNGLLFFIETSSSRVIAYKAQQIYDLLVNPNLSKMAKEPSSIGNLIAESLTLKAHFQDHALDLVIGKGFGAGIKDTYGYLYKWTELGGYPFRDAVRNDFFNLHLPVLKILLNAGAFIFCLFVRILIQLFRSKRVFDFLAFIVLFLYFNVSKEYLLLGYILLRISEIERFCTDQISLSNE